MKTDERLIKILHIYLLFISHIVKYKLIRVSLKCFCVRQIKKATNNTEFSRDDLTIVLFYKHVGILQLTGQIHEK